MMSYKGLAGFPHKPTTSMHQGNNKVVSSLGICAATILSRGFHPLMWFGSSSPVDVFSRGLCWRLMFQRLHQLGIV